MKKGLTLIELLVSLTILSIIVTLTFSILLKVKKTQDDLNKKYRLTEATDRIQKELEDNIRFCSRIISGSAASIKLLDSNNDTIEYTVNDDTLYKNGCPISRVLLDSFLIFYHVKDDYGQTIAYQDLGAVDYRPPNTGGDIIGVDIFVMVKNPISTSDRVKIKRRFYVRLRSPRDF